MKKYTVKVIPRSSRNQVQEIAPGDLKVKLMAPPVDGKANEALIEVLAKHFGVKKGQIRILRGETSQNKMIEIDA